MIEKMTHVSLLVKDSEEALDFYINKLGFSKVTDIINGPMRFVTVAPQGQGTEIVLMRPDPSMGGEVGMKMMIDRIGKAPMLLFKVDDCQKTFDELRMKGVKIVQEPAKAPFGMQAFIADLYGNPLLLVEHPHK